MNDMFSVQINKKYEKEKILIQTNNLFHFFKIATNLLKHLYIKFNNINNTNTSLNIKDNHENI